MIINIYIHQTLIKTLKYMFFALKETEMFADSYSIFIKILLPKK